MNIPLVLSAIGAVVALTSGNREEPVVASPESDREFFTLLQKSGFKVVQGSIEGFIERKETVFFLAAVPDAKLVLGFGYIDGDLACKGTLYDDMAIISTLGFDEDCESALEAAVENLVALVRKIDGSNNTVVKQVRASLT